MYGFSVTRQSGFWSQAAFTVLISLTSLNTGSDQRRIDDLTHQFVGGCSMWSTTRNSWGA